MEYIKNIQKQSKVKTGTPATRVRIMEEIFSLCPSYSIKQLKKINTIRIQENQKRSKKITFSHHSSTKTNNHKGCLQTRR